MKFNKYLRSIGACQPAIDWVGDKTLAQAWAENQNPQLAIWLLSFADYRAAVRLAARFALKVLNLVESGDREICEAAIKFAEFWADSPTEANRLAAGAAARAAAGVADAAEWAAAGVAEAAWAAAGAAWAAEGAAWAAARAAGAAARAAGAAARAAGVAARAAGVADAAGAAEHKWQMEQIRTTFPTIKIEGVE